MFKTMFSKGILPVAELGSSFAEQRHQVLANNIANIDTPYFKSKDLAVDEFRKALSKAIDDRNRKNPRIWNMNPTRHVQEGTFGIFGRTLHTEAVKQDKLNILAHDENKRSIEAEMSTLGKNAAYHRLMNALMVHEFGSLESAIRERP